MDLLTVRTASAPKALGPYSQAIVAGDLVFCAGQIPLDPETDQVVQGDIAAQTERALANLEAVLREAGSGLDRVVKTTVFMADLGEFSAMNEAYARAFGGHRPARSTFQVAALPRGAKIEIECIAVRG